MPTSPPPEFFFLMWGNKISKAFAFENRHNSSFRQMGAGQLPLFRELYSIMALQIVAPCDTYQKSDPIVAHFYYASISSLSLGASFQYVFQY